MGEVATHGAKRPHAKEVIFGSFSLLLIGGERRNLEVMGEAAAHGAKRLITRDDNIMPIVNGGSPDLSM